jgi:hypothetical protein
MLPFLLALKREKSGRGGVDTITHGVKCVKNLEILLQISTLGSFSGWHPAAVRLPSRGEF